MGSGRAVRVGDMHWVDLPAANGREQRGRRPAVVLQDDDYGGDLPVVLFVPPTTAPGAMRFSGTTLIYPTAEKRVRDGAGGPRFSITGHFPASHYGNPGDA